MTARGFSRQVCVTLRGTALGFPSWGKCPKCLQMSSFLGTVHKPRTVMLLVWPFLWALSASLCWQLLEKIPAVKMQQNT